MCSNLGKFFRLPHFYKPLLLAFAIMFFQQFCGINAVIIYQMDIFEQSGSTLDPHTCSIITGGVLFMATLVGSLIVDKFGRKLLLVISGIGMALALVPLAYYFQVIDHETPEAAAKTSAEYGWVALVSLVLFLASFNIALGPIPWMMVPEITPSAARSSVAALATCFSWSLAFIFIKWFPLLEQIAGKSVVFYTFATISLLSCIFTCFLLPETKGKSLHELEQLFIPQNILSDNSFDSN
ncbi:Facilitated trehalose transporter Tret1 [Halotydeus destructor]|nr:Facilitated trehalose transporter Tret1 [Halotydeus destructor]